jgi:hypothetical protein
MMVAFISKNRDVGIHFLKQLVTALSAQPGVAVKTNHTNGCLAGHSIDDSGRALVAETAAQQNGLYPFVDQFEGHRFGSLLVTRLNRGQLYLRRDRSLPVFLWINLRAQKHKRCF